ncbi:MAG: amino acid ABC transporter permease [Chloroflexota bacterium]
MTTDQSAVLETRRGSRLAPSLDSVSNWPWWLLVAILIALYIVYQITTDEQTNVIFRAVSKGVGTTILVALVGYGVAVTIGLVVGLGRVAKNKLFFNAAAFYVEIIRGVPMIVLLMYTAFVAVPLGIQGLNAIGAWLEESLGLTTFLSTISTRDIDNLWRVTFGLGIAYGAFEAEIFRAGIQSIEKGQMEAARAMGMSYFQAMRYIILPQAIRRIFPALGNDFVAMVKDSSLVSVLGVQDITQLAKLYAASTFLFFQTYSILAFMYLVITIMLTRIVRRLEGRMSRDRR